ncbi:hypothetical protein DFQ27_000607 [Actinomortierella ambigua]|uniref:Uncharacterized protein n=1 Tax=Actinomortierella ambigua TaxID=1343610 RepID=A0A9P6QFJ9_9FUNG|nr:hypothetical protein DFQ27_000607 [Actinomortierella ambigua]
MSQGTIGRKVQDIFIAFQRSRKVWNDLVSDGLTQANALVNVQLQQGYVDHPAYWSPVLAQFEDLKDRFEAKLQRKAQGLASDLEATLTKLNAQYIKMKQQHSQLEHLIEEATETFGERFTYSDPIGATCTLEQLWIHFQRVFNMYSEQWLVNQDIVDQILVYTKKESLSDHPPSHSTTGIISSAASNVPPGVAAKQGMVQRQDKDKAMILLSAWLNQPHLMNGPLADFDDLCKVELEV